MKRNRLILIVLICTLIVIPSCVAIEEEVAGPTVDIEMGIRDDDVSKVGIDFIINNPSQKEVSLTGFKYYVYTDREKSPSQSSEGGMSESLKPTETATKRESFFITSGTPLKQFLRKGSINLTVNGSLLVKVDADSFGVPFEKVATVYLKTEEERAKLAICPNITGIELKTSKLVNPSGEITNIFVNMNITITNPNPVAICLNDYDYDVYFKKEGKWIRLFPRGFGGAPTIEPMNTYTIIVERRISDNEVIQYLTRSSPTDIKVKGLMFMFPKEKGWAPTYFEPPFETVITTINGSGMTGEVTQPSTPSPTIQTTETPPLPGYKWYYDETGYKIAYPDDWELVFPEIVSGFVRINNITENDSKSVESCVWFDDDLRTPTYVTVTVKSVNWTNLEEGEKRELETLEKLATVLEKKEIVVNGRKGFEVIYKRPFGVPVKQKLVLFVANGRSYTIHCSTSEELYDKYKDTFDNIINSFGIPTIPTSTPGFEVIFVIAGLLAMAYFLRRRK